MNISELPTTIIVQSHLQPKPIRHIRNLPQAKLEVMNRVTKLNKSRPGIEAAPEDLDLAVIEILTRRRRRPVTVPSASPRRVKYSNPPGNRRSSAHQGMRARSEDLPVALVDGWVIAEVLRIVKKVLKCVGHAAEVDELRKEGFHLLLDHHELATNLVLRVYVAGDETSAGMPFCGGDAGDDECVDGHVVAAVLVFQIIPF